MANNQLTISKEGDPKTLKSANIIDLSEGGLKLSCSENFNSGTNLDIVLELEGESAPIQLKATVVRVAPVADSPGQFASGVRFLNATEEIRERLRAVVTRRLNAQNSK